MNFNAKSNSSAPLPKRKSLSAKEKARAHGQRAPRAASSRANREVPAAKPVAVETAPQERIQPAAEAPTSAAPSRAKRTSVRKTASRAADLPAAETPDPSSTYEPTFEPEPAAEPQPARRRVGDERRALREERARRARRRYTLYVAKIIGAIVLAAGLIIGAIALYSSDFTAIEKVQVEGATHLTDEEVTQAAQVPAGSTLLRLDKTTIIANLEAEPWIASATITREFPNKIVLHIEEEEAAAVVKVGKNWWVISKGCTWLSLATKAERKEYLRVASVDSSVETPVAGAATDDSGITAADQLLSEISVDYRDAIKRISADSAAKLSMKLRNGVQVAWGEVEDTEIKEAAVWALLEKYENTISYINVRVATKPTFRTLND